jgi:hypothetical protein
MRFLNALPQCGKLVAPGNPMPPTTGMPPMLRDAKSIVSIFCMRCFHASDPLPGASGTGSSVWSRLGDLLIEQEVFPCALFVPLPFGGIHCRLDPRWEISSPH